MNILMITQEFPPTQMGGAEMQCLKQARALVQRGHAVTVVTRWLNGKVPRHEIMDGVKVFRMGWLLPFTMKMRRVHDSLVSLKPGSGGRLYRNGAPQSIAPQSKAKRFWWSAPALGVSCMKSQREFAPAD